MSDENLLTGVPTEDLARASRNYWHDIATLPTGARLVFRLWGAPVAFTIEDVKAELARRPRAERIRAAAELRYLPL